MRTRRQKAASAYRQGDSGRPLGQGESLATAADLLVFRQSLGRETGDGQSRQTDARGWTGDYGDHAGIQTQSHRHAATARIPTATACGASTFRKPTGRWRPLGIPTMKDRAMQALHLLALDPSPKPRRTKTPTAFARDDRRPTPSSSASKLLCRKTAPAWVLEGDIASCFDNISHEWMLRQCPDGPRRSCTGSRPGTWKIGTLFPTEAGTPQGGIISPALANLTWTDWNAVANEPLPRKDLERTASGSTPQGQPRALCGRLHHHREPKERCWRTKSGHWSKQF